MTNRYSPFLFLFLFLITCLFHQPVKAQAASKPDSVTSVFQEGINAIYNGNEREAVAIWSAALEDPSTISYKLGYHFIKTVTSGNMRDYYEQASRMYYAGLDASSLDEDDLIFVAEDFEFIKPLLGRREANDWDDFIENKNPAVLTKLSDFWDSMRVSLSRDYNGRLLEHWERRRFVEQNFNTSSRSAFDDRGAIYLKFGSPTYKRDGTLLYNSGFAEYVLSARMRDGGGFTGNAVEATSFLNTSYMVREYHQYPMYEVWVYRELAEDEDNIIYIFGNSTGSNVMNQMESIDEFVPSAAYNISGRNSSVSFAGSSLMAGDEQQSDDEDEQDTDVAFETNDAVTANKENISPGLVLQLMYYRQLATIDDYFSSQYSEMMDRYMSTSTYLGKSISKEFQLINSSRLLRRQGRAPDHSSSHAKELFSIQSDLYAYRFLDENMAPYLKVYLEADSEEAISYEELRAHNSVQEIDESRFLIVNKLESYDDSGAIVESQQDTFRVSGSEDPMGQNLIEIYHRLDAARLAAIFELHNGDLYGEKSISTRTTFRNYLLGIGSSETETEEVIDSGSFTSSDVILGYTAKDDSSSSYSIAHHARIPYRQNLNLYYEAYNLPVNEDGLYSYTLTYEIARQRSWLGNLVRFGRSSGPSITIDNINDEPRFAQTLEIVSQDLERGEYTLRLTFETPGDDVIQTKEIEFEII